MTTESRDRSALRLLYAADQTGDILRCQLAMQAARHALALPDPAQELAEALRQCLRHLEQDSQGLLAGKAARAALAKYEAK